MLSALRQAVRALLAAPLVSALAVASIALGIGSVATVYSTANAFTFRPLPQFDRPERLVVISEAPASEAQRDGMSPGAFLDLQASTHTLGAVTATNNWYANIAGSDLPERVVGLQATAGFFAVAGRVPQLGHFFTAADDVPGAAPVVVLSDGLWRRRFGGDPTIVGRLVRINGEAWTVTGVMPPGFAFPNGAQLWVPLALSPEARLARRDRSLNVMGRLADGATAASAVSEAAALGRRLATDQPETNTDWTVRVERAEEYFGRGPRPFIIALLGAVAFLLLISCANVANLLLARATARQREMAVRLALGATWRHLARQMLVESALLATAGGALGLLLAQWGVRATTMIIPAELHLVITGFDALRVDGRVAAVAAAVTMAVAMLFGLVPALAAARTDVQGALKDGARNAPSGRGARRLRSALVTGEIAMALPLLTGAALMVVSARRLLSSDLGFQADGVLTMAITLPKSDYPTDSAAARFWDALVDDAATVPGVRAAALTNVLPMSWNEQRTRVEVEGQPLRRPEDAPAVGLRMVSPGFTTAFRVPLLSGRALTADDRANQPAVAVVSEAAAQKLWPGGRAVGRRLKVRDQRWVEVVGVVGNVRGNVLNSADPRSVLYLPVAQWPGRTMLLAVTTSGDPAALMGGVVRRIAVLDPRLAAGDVKTMRDVVASVGSPQTASAQMMATAALIALLMAAIGTYGVMAYTVAQRTHEIGVRVALGARARDVVRLVLRQASGVVGLGLLLGIAAALGMGVALKAVLFETSAADPWMILGTALALAGVAGVATWVPAVRAARVEPMVALRAE